MTLTVERLGHLGDGIAPGPVYVPRALPGEVVDGEIAGHRIEKPRILTPSQDRVRPPCPHYSGCGGCALQHASDAFVADWKADVVRQALTARGLDAPIRRIVTSPPGTRRRATLAGRRTRKGAIVGFHARASDTITPVPDCTVLHPALRQLLRYFETVAARYASRKGEIGFAATLSDAGADLLVTGGKPPDGPMRNALADWAARAGLARLTWEDEPVVQRAPPVQHFDGIAVTPPPGAFLQATAHGEAALRASVAEAIGPSRAVVDLFAGCGTFALPLARTAPVHAVEGDTAMLAALDAGWRLAKGLKRVTTEARDLFRNPLGPGELAGYDAAIIDPPRAGAEAQMHALAKAAIPRIAAVSCNPVSFARDAEILTAAGYRIGWIDVVDQFRWSPHVELAALFHSAHIASDATQRRLA